MMLQGLISFLNQVQDAGTAIVPDSPTTHPIDTDSTLLRVETATEHLRQVAQPWYNDGDGYFVLRNLLGEELGRVQIGTTHIGPEYWMEWVEKGLLEQGYTLLKPQGDW